MVLQVIKITKCVCEFVCVNQCVSSVSVCVSVCVCLCVRLQAYIKNLQPEKIASGNEAEGRGLPYDTHTLLWVHEEAPG